MIVLFGANGFLGRNITRHLLNEGLPVRAVVRRPDPEFIELARGAEIAYADLGDPGTVSRALVGAEVAIQLASIASPHFGNSRMLEDLNSEVVPQVRFLELCKSLGLRRVIFTSSGGTVYGSPLYKPIDEAHPTRPRNSYGLTKLITERYYEFFSANLGLDCCVLRIANPFGPHQSFRNGQGLIPNIALHCLRGTPVPVYGSGEAERDYLYVQDLVDAVLASVRLPQARGRVINIGSGIGRSVRDVLAAFERALGQPVPQQHIPMRDTDVEHNVLNIDLAREVLDWSPRTDFETGLQQTLRWFGLPNIS